MRGYGGIVAEESKDGGGFGVVGPSHRLDLRHELALINRSMILKMSEHLEGGKQEQQEEEEEVVEEEEEEEASESWKKKEEEGP